MATLLDPRGNEFLGALDAITGFTVTDGRAAAATLGALNAEADVDLNGHATMAFDLRTGAGNLTATFEATVDGTNYFVIPVIDQATNAVVTSVAVTTTLAKTYIAGVAGYRRVRVRISAFTSGNIAVAMRASSGSQAQIAPMPQPSQLVVSTLSTANTAVTATLPAAGAGLFHYITGIEIVRNATAALAGSATLTYTTTNLPGTLAWSVGNAMAVGGTQWDVQAFFPAPLKSSAANTATTVVAPAAGAAVLVRINVYYFVGA